MSGPKLSVVGARRSSLDDRPVIVMEPGRLSQKTDEVENAILRNYREIGLYQYADTIVRVASAGITEKAAQWVTRSPDATILVPATPPMLMDIFGRAIRFEKGEGAATDCPPKVANIYLSRGREMATPHIDGNSQCSCDAARRQHPYRTRL